MPPKDNNKINERFFFNSQFLFSSCYQYIPVGTIKFLNLISIQLAAQPVIHGLVVLELKDK